MSLVAGRRSGKPQCGVRFDCEADERRLKGMRGEGSPRTRPKGNVHDAPARGLTTFTVKIRLQFYSLYGKGSGSEPVVPAEMKKFVAFGIMWQKYYGAIAVNKCKENEIQHFCKYHSKSIERETDSTEGKPRTSSKDFYIEVSPGTYSVTAISEDMVEQTHVVDINAGQTIDVTFTL
ncbi:hypothetical protein DUI87_09741 [Hirundo rustica rustica]|uniref:AKIP1 protein n=1 Tax=Hirundo rustica rustica TaxID=333673 RepID=A0A3M0KMM9_HIRRU|nr:hypothetical protein DUI87_09741 [Hirundo rustica rustica]